MPRRNLDYKRSARSCDLVGCQHEARRLIDECDCAGPSATYRTDPAHDGGAGPSVPPFAGATTFKLPPAAAAKESHLHDRMPDRLVVHRDRCARSVLRSLGTHRQGAAPSGAGCAICADGLASDGRASTMQHRQALSSVDS